MTDVTFLVVLVAGCWLIGWLPCQLLLPAGRVAGRELAAPVLGFALYGIVAAVLYRLNLSAPLLVLVFVGLATAGFALTLVRPPERPRSGDLVLIAVGLAVALLLLLPKWTGGPQFFVFQGNIWDQFNYLSRTIGYRDFRYDELMAIDRTAPLLNNFVVFARGELFARPAVSIVHAAVLPFSAEPPTLNAYVFMVFLQLLSFFALAFVVVAVVGKRAPIAAALAAALTLGFFLQYVFDINAWSQLAGMPLILLASTLALLVLGDGPVDRRRLDDLRLAAAAALALAATFYYYPEIVPIYLLPLAVVAGLTLIPTAGRTVALGRVMLLVGAVLLALALTAPCWESTTAFLIRQFTTSMSQSVDWFLFFQRYLAPADLTAFFTIGYKTGHLPADGLWQALLFMPIDFVTGLFGLYMLQPPVDLPLAVRVVWRLVVMGLLGVLLVPALWSALKVAWRGEDQTALLLRLALLALLMPLPFVALGKVWGAGKAIAMIGPFLFLLVVVPLLRSGQSIVRRLPALVFLAIQLGFGLARPLAAAHPDGIHFALPYPSVERAELKTRLSWDLRRWDETLRACRRIAVDTENPFLERYVQLHLTDLQSVWWSVRPLNGYYDRGPVYGLQSPRGEPDCTVTDRGSETAVGSPAVTVIDLGRRSVARP